MSKYATAYENGKDLRRCDKCGSESFHMAKKVMIFSPHGMTIPWLWSCEVHPLPDSLIDEAK